MIAVRPVSIYILAVIFCAIASLDDACPAGQFDCTGTGNGNGTSCISAALVCNNIVNCPTGGLDENTAMICGCKRVLPQNNNCVCVVGPGNEIFCGCASGTVPINMNCVRPAIGTGPPQRGPGGHAGGPNEPRGPPRQRAGVVPPRQGKRAAITQYWH